MPPKIRKTLLVRLIAAGFIYLIVLGNIWFGMSLTSRKTPVWMQYMFSGGVLLILLLSLILASYALYLWRTNQLFEKVEGENGADSEF